MRDVVAHLVGVDEFWVFSTTGALAGEPSRSLTGFDPVATPPQLIEGRREQSPPELLAAYRAGVDTFGNLVTGLDAAQWAMLADAPPGHVSLHAMVRHAIWDAWIHERDILLPLGLDPTVEADEVQACLEYVAALGPVILAASGSPDPGTLAVVGTDPDARAVVELDEIVRVTTEAPVPEGAVVLQGPSVDLVEALSLRAPLPQPVRAEDRPLLSGLATAFDTVLAG